MNNEQLLQSILHDLYALDPGLKAREGEVVKIVEKLLSAKPTVKIDAQFLKSLKQELLSQFTQQKNETNYQFNILNFMSKFKFATAGAVIAILVIAPLTYYVTKQGGVKQSVSLLQSERKSQDGQFGISMGDSLGDHAFGSLIALGTPGDAGSALRPAAPMAAQQGETSIPAMDSSSLSVREGAPVPPGLGGDGTAGKMMPSSLIYPAPDMVNYQFKYQGDELVLEDEKVEVLRREKGFTGSGSVSQLLGRIGDGLIDFGKFSNTKLQNFSFIEDKDFGFFVNVDLQEGMISVNQNWMRWPQAQCQDQARLDSDTARQACWDTRRVKEGDIPSDDALIKLANDFMKEKGISLKGYGEPEVDRSWRVMYERMAAAERASYYFPEQVSVKYPLIIEGEKVYEGPGQTAGLYASIDVKERRMSGVSNLIAQRYARSQYEAITDAAKVIAVAEEGGMQSYYPYGLTDGKTQVLTLGTPERGYMKHWQYKDNVSNELLVPALIFPVQNPASEGWAPTQVIVPLVKEILDSRTTGNPDGPIRIMPAEAPTPLMEKQQ